MRRECCKDDSDGRHCKPLIRFERFHHQQQNEVNPESKKKRKREEMLKDEKANVIVGLISVSVREELLKELWLSSLNAELSGGKTVITHNSNLLNDLPAHSELIHDQLVESLFIEENSLAIHLLVEKEKDLETCRMELRALSGYSQDFELYDMDWSSDLSNITCVKPEIKKTNLNGFISVESNNQHSSQSNILDRENCKNKIKIWICFLKNGQLLSSKDALALLESVSAKDRLCEIRVDNQDTVIVKESSFNDSNESRKLFHLLFSNTEKYGIKFTNLNTTQDSTL